MEYWIKKGEDAMQLPIKPASFNVSMSNSHQTVNVQTRGDVTILGKKGLKTYAFESFFPARDYPFADYAKDRNPWEYIKKLLEWQEDPLQLIITSTKINKKVIIKDFTFAEEDGTGDVKYSLTFEDYRPPKVSKKKKKTETPTTITTPTKKPEKTQERTDSKKKSKTHTVSGNDTLWSIAKKYYGSGAEYMKIYNANKNVIEKIAKKYGKTSSSHNGVAGWWIYDGTKLVIP